MGIMTNQNACRAKLILILVALAVMAGYQSGFAETRLIELTRKAAEQGGAQAQYLLGVRYANGEGVPQDDGEAVKWYRKAAEQGHANAQFNLGGMYANGKGVPEDDREALKWHRMAAEQDHEHAQRRLGDMYSSGIGVPKDDIEAFKWYRRAAEQGNWYSQWELGNSYAYGRGVPKDFVSAYAWWNVAAAHPTLGHSNLPWKPAKDRDELSEKMTSEQVAEAQRLAGELFDRIKSSKSE